MELVKGDAPDMTATIIALLAYHHDPKNWFLQVESIFSMLRIISQGAKFANVLQQHPSDMMDKISDVIADLPEQKSYNHLKEAILKHTGCSEAGMIPEILQNVTRGDKMPTQLLQYMKNQLGKHMLEKVLHGLCLECLPKSVTQIIALVTRATPLDDLAESADLVFTQFNHSINAVHTSHNEERAVQTEHDRTGVGQPAETSMENTDFSASTDKETNTFPTTATNPQPKKVTQPAYLLVSSHICYYLRFEDRCFNICTSCHI